MPSAVTLQVHPPDGTSRTITRRSTEVRAAPSLADGLPPESHHEENSTAEADWIATRIESIPGTNHLGRIGILTRTHKRSEAVSRALTQLGIDPLTVEQFVFFRRQEIKDLLARLHLLLLLNPSDTLDIARRFLNLERHDLTTVSRHFRNKEPRHSCRAASGMRKNRAELPTFLPPLARRTRVSTLRQTPHSEVRAEMEAGK